MTREEAIKMIKAKLECMTRDVSGRDSDCINRRCDECPLNYEKGNMGEQKEWLRMAIEAIGTMPNEDCISRKSMLEGLANIAKAKAKSDAQKSLMGRVMFFAEHLPSVTPQSEKHTEERTETHACDCISRKGHWIEHKRGEIEHIECSECRCWFLRKDLIRNSYCPNCGSRNHWEWELKMQEVKK